MSNYRSKVREHFTVDTINKLNECNHCDYVIREKASTSTLWKHLESKHPTSYEQAKNMNDSQIVCSNLITVLITTSLVAPTIVENVIFKELLNTWKKGLELPSRRSIMETHVVNLNNNLVDDLTEISKDRKLSITSDCWSHIHSRFIDFSVRTLDIEGNVMNFCADVIPLNISHTAENISEKLEDLRVKIFHCEEKCCEHLFRFGVKYDSFIQELYTYWMYYSHISTCDKKVYIINHNLSRHQ